MKTSVSKRMKLLSVVAALLLVCVAFLYFHHLPNFLDRYLEVPTFFLKSYPRTDLTTHKPVDCEMDSNIEFHKNFVYLMMTESCIPDELMDEKIFGDPKACNCDLVVLGFKSQCTGTYPSHVKHIHTPGTSWTTGRTLLYNTVKDEKYLYYVFVDDDVRLKLLAGTDRNPYRVFEDFLYRFRPPIAAVDTDEWRFIDRVLRFRDHYGCDKPLEEYITAVFYDPMYNAFHHDAMVNVLEKVIPYWSAHESSSIWFSQSYVCLLGTLVYKDQMVHPTDLLGLNPQHRPYARSFETKEVIDDIMATVEKLIPDEYKEKLSSYVDELKSQTSVYRLRQRGYFSFCRTPPSPGCAKPYENILSQPREIRL